MSNSYRGRSTAKSVGRRRSGGSGILVLIVVLVLLIGVIAGVFALLNPGGGGQPVDNPDVTATQGGGLIESGTFYEGVYVDDIPLGGLTVEQAKTQIEAGQQKYAAASVVTVTKDAESWQFTAEQTNCSFDTAAVLEQAWKQGREGTDAERKAAIEQLVSTPVKLVTTATIDASPLEEAIRALATPYTKAAVDAKFVKYDKTKAAGQRLIFTADVPGEQVDADALWAGVKTAFETKAFGTVAMQVAPLPAAITVASLKGEMALVGEFTSDIKNYTKERRTNITLASAAVNGKILMPGDTLSVNEATGPRTAAKGYQKAPVDANGIEDVGLGGGVCQVSSALYNAAIASGPNRIQIVERNHHSLVSGYMKKGTDATVDYPGKDLKFKNISDKPILIIAYYDYDKARKSYDYQMHAEFYSVPDPEGAKYVLEGDVVKTLKGDSTKQRTAPSNALKPGQTKLIAAHNGYVVDVYLVKIDKNGKKTRVKKLYTDTYPSDCNVLAYYKDDAVPTATPSPTPTPDNTPTPATRSPTPPPATHSPEPPASTEPPVSTEPPPVG